MAKAMFHHGRRGFRWPRAVLAQAPDEPSDRLAQLVRELRGRRLRAVHPGGECNRQAACTGNL
jgi:hypothetical protein